MDACILIRMRITPARRRCHTGFGIGTKPPKVVGHTSTAIEESKAIADKIDRLAEELTDHGYRVFRMPYLYTRPEPPESTQPSNPDRQRRSNTNSKPAEEQEEQLKPTYPEITYNNVLMENVDGQSIVYLPQYGWQTFDEAAGKAWADLGFEVRPIDGLTISAMYGGSLRCCIKVLAR